MLLPESQTEETWEPSEKQYFSEIGEYWIEKYFYFLSLNYCYFPVNFFVFMYGLCAII